MKQRQVDPADYDDMDEFVDDCVADRQDDNPNEDDDTALEACLLQWGDAQDERGVNRNRTVVRKTHASKADGLDFVLSDETPDRYGDVIAADGWILDNFKRNPIALFGHSSSFPIGTWKDLSVEGGALKGHLQLAPAGTSDRIDELRKLVEAGILRAVSVGFLPIEKKTMDAKADDFFGPFKYLKQELIETSLVSIPANPNALAVARGLNVSNDTLEIVFGKHAGKNTTRAVVRRNGKQAETSRNGKRKTMSTLAQRIKDAEKRLNENRDKLAAHLEQSDDNNVTDADLETRKTLTDEIVRVERTLDSLRESEKHLGQASEDGGGRAVVAAHTARANGSTAISSARPFNVAAKKLSPIDLFIRAGAIQIVAQRDRRPVDEVRRMVYGDDEATRAVLEWQTKAASAVASTTVAGWAAELVQQIVTDFMATLMPK
jgi:HK97 family phage prohead protease